ncbi:ATP-dependent RNA helicase DEAH12, chloroplastic [Dirofilaria immitis]
MLDQKQSTEYVHLFINNCVSYETAIQLLQSVLSRNIGLELRITNFERNERISWVTIALFGKIDEEIMSIFKSRCAEIGLENIEIISDRSVPTLSIRSHSIAHQQQSYFTKEMELLKQHNETSNQRRSYNLSLHNEEQIAFMEQQIREWTTDVQDMDEFTEQMVEKPIREHGSVAECIDPITKVYGCYINDRDIKRTSEDIELPPVVKIDYNYTYMIAKCSVPPMHMEHESCTVEGQSWLSEEKVYGKPPVFVLDSFSTKFLDLIFGNQIFLENNAGKSINGIHNVNRQYPKLVPSPPWQQSVCCFRGRFNYDMGRLAMLNKINGQLEFENVDDPEFLEKEILKRKCRLEIFNEINAKHIRMLRKSPNSAGLITELMNHEIERFACGLPVYNIRKDIQNILCKQSRVLIIIADTGSGKSTQIPQYLAFDGIITASQKILCSQPRKVAVCKLAMRVANETSLSSHCLVNFSVCKNGLKPNLNAKINFITEKHLLDYIQQDHKLSQFGCVMIDEVHERTVNTDMCLGMMKRVLQLRPDMKLVITSATLDPEPLLNYFAEFQVRKLEVPGRQYSIKICYEPPISGCRGIKSLMRDYINRTVEKVIKICESEAKKQPFEDIPWEYSLETHAAHIMAFLSNPRETLIAEERLAKRLAELKHSVQVKIITLYGNMPLENRAEVFASLEPGYHHKVIFATNIGETSITIPGVRYIVDCGLAKVKKFDAIRRKNVLELSLISKSAAKQRAGRAGRTAPGICYRLYSEEQYEEMESIDVPKILLTDLAEVMLYMIDAGIMNPAEFDFIEKPNSGALLHSQALLRSLQAIECCETKLVLTQLGKKMKQLPVEPRLAKMVLDSVQYDLVAEAAVVSAYIHVGSLFYRGNNQNKFILADQKKLSFCEESGDPMTSLAVFHQYINTPRNRLKNWCFKNYINSKHMKSVLNIACKICKIVSYLTGVSADINKIDISKARRIIPNLFCRSFGSNLAMYSGLPEHEYYDFNEKKYVFIHPSSALKYSDVTPEFIVYECSLYTSKDFVLNVCAADSSWLNEIDQNIFEEKRKNKLVPYNVRCGAVIKQWIMEHMDIIHQEVSKECMWKKRFDDPYHRLQIYVPVKDLPKMKTFVDQIIKEKVNVLSRQTREVPIMDTDYMLHMSGSGTPLEILMPDEFCSMYVGSGGINWKDDAAYRMELEEYFGRFGKITEFVTFDEKYQKKIGHSCIIRMESKEAAKRAFICSSENRCDFNIEPRFGRKYFDKIGNYRPSAYRLLIKWWRRPSYGHGQIKLKSRDFDQRMHAFDVISKHLGRFQPSLLSEHLSERDPSDDLYKIKLLSVPLDIDSKQLLHIFGPLLNAYGIEFDEIYVVRKKIYPVEDEMALEEHSQRISDHIIKVAKDSVNSNSYPFEVKIRAPKHPGEIEFVAFVLFSDMDLGIRVGNALKEAAENGLPLEMGPLNQMHEAHVQQLFQYQMKVPRALFNAIFGDLRNIYNGIDHEHVDFNHHSDGKICHLFIAGEDFNFVNEVKAAVDKIINGCTIKCRDGERIDGVELPCHRLLTKVGQDFLRNLPQKYTIFLNISLYKMEVRIQGSISNVEKAKMEIKRFLREWLDADINQTLILQPPDYQPGTLKTLLAQNGYDLYSLEKQFGHGLHLDANIVRRELSFIGKEAQFQDLLNMLRSISDSIRSKDFSETAFNEVEIPKCVICLCVADLENYCLEVCGHYACRSCLNMQLKTSIETRHFPIVCVACEKPFTWSDLEVLVLENLDRNKDEDPQKLQSLSDASLACFVERHGDLYKHCLTPNCRGLHPVTIDAGLGRCRLCGRVQCTKCGKEEHESITCEEYAILKINADESVRKWIREDQTTRRICPNQNCQAVIEKLGGCNHMQCLQCKQHFCWICMFAATESNEIYAHMDAEHGGSGADMRELIAEMENDPFIREYIERQHPALLLDPEFNFGEEAEFWIMHDEDAVDELFMANNDEVHNFFEYQQELNELFNEGRDEPSVGFEVHTDFEEDEEEDANIV